jgi:uncharacterized membrane protein (DUF2068 family)
VTPSRERSRHPPGPEKPKRFRPRFHWELLVCGLQGHELVGTDAAHLRPEEAPVARESDGLRWHRCLRCDSWLPLDPPTSPSREYPPARDEIELPLRGRALRDKIVLRLIAVDRALHFVVLALLAAAIFVFAANESRLRGPFYRVLADVQGGLGGPAHSAKHGFLHEVDRLFSLDSSTIRLVGAVVLLYAVVEGLEAVGLWLQKRWAEYLTFIATAALLPLEVYELSRRLSPLKVVTLVLNIAVVAYLLLAKRLFGLRGGAAAERAERDRDSGWPLIDRTAPRAAAAVTAGGQPASTG